MHTVTDYSVPSADGIHTLSGVIYKPQSEIKGLFHLVHGMTEYIGRYDPLMSFLADAGYLVFGYDHLGHGKTARDESELGFIAHKDGWRYLVEDVIRFEDAVQKEYPDLSLVLMGHSMGSFIVRLAAEKPEFRGTKLIVCGTGGPNPAAPVGLLICDVMRLLFGEKHISPLVESVAFGAYNRQFEGLSPYDWLTKDRAVIARYEKDPFCTFHFTVSAMHDLVELNARCNKRKWFSAFRKDLPVLLIAGDRDPVGNYGKGVTAVYDRLKGAGVRDVTLRLYENCRHEIHNDTCKDEMFADIHSFIST